MAIKKIVSALDIESRDIVLEIGPGTGILTKEILKYTEKIIAVEKDARLIEDLKSLSNSSDFKIVEGDIRKDLLLLANKLTSYKLVGNIPYYLTGQLLRILSELNNPPTIAVLMLQKEVAQRICCKEVVLSSAGAGFIPLAEDEVKLKGLTKSNQLSLITELWAKPKILFHLKPSDFYPQPKVSSSIIKFEIISQKKRQKDEKEIINLIKLGFEHPRKTLINNLSKKFEKQKIEDCLIEMNLKKNVRPENLSLKYWLELKKMIELM